MLLIELFQKKIYKENIYGEIEEQKVELYKDLDEEGAVDFFDYIDKDAKIENLEETLDPVLDDIEVKKEEKEEENNIIVENNKPKSSKEIREEINRKYLEKDNLGKYLSNEFKIREIDNHISVLKKQLKLNDENDKDNTIIY